MVSQRLPLELTPQGTQSYVSTFKLKNPHLWQGREDPYLYKVVSRLLANGEVIDEVTQPLGVRHYEIVAGKGFILMERNIRCMVLPVIRTGGAWGVR